MTDSDPKSTAPAGSKVLREVDDEAIGLARNLLRGSATGSLAWLEPGNNWPCASLVTVATMPDGSPLVLISALSAHTRALRRNPACGLLLCRAGAGDPLAHPRISLQASARFLERESPAGLCARRRFLNRHHKAALYADFADFSFVRLELRQASLNGGFGKAYELSGEQLVPDHDNNSGDGGGKGDFDAVEQAALEHMNKDHPDAVRACARAAGRADSVDWRLTGIDPYGIDLIDRGEALRIAFKPPLGHADEIHKRLVDMARQARKEETARS